MADKTTQAVLKGLSLAPRKVSLVAALVRGRTVADALVILEHTPKRPAKDLAKVINSAKANAINTHGMLEQDMIIEKLTVTAGPRLKRFKPAAMGRALPFQKKTSHITVVVRSAEKPKKRSPVVSQSTTGKPVAKKEETK